MATEQERNRGAGAYSSPGVDQPFKPGPFVPLSSPPVFTFAIHGLQPPSQLYITTSDRLQLNVENSVTNAEVDVHYRLLEPDGQIHHGFLPFFPTNDRTDNTFQFALAEGFLLSLSIGSSPVTTRKGQTFASIRLIAGSANNAVTRGVLLAGYLAGRRNLVWPINQPETTIDGSGFLRVVSGTLPAAGAEVNEVVPSGARWRLRTIFMQLTTSATVANRTVNVQVDDGAGTTFGRYLQAVVIPASTVAIITFGPGLAQAALAATQLNAPIPTDTVLLQGHHFRTSTTNLQAGDQYTAPQYEVEEWLEL